MGEDWARASGRLIAPLDEIQQPRWRRGRGTGEGDPIGRRKDTEENRQRKESASNQLS